MSTLRQAAEQVLEALDEVQQCVRTTDWFNERVDALRAALAQPQDEPVHQFRKQRCADWYDGIPDHHDGHGPYETRTLYAAPTAQAEALPDFIRRRIEQAINESSHPKGMSLHDGKVRVLGSDLAYLLRWIDRASAAPAQAEPVLGTKTWFEDGKLIIQHLTASDIYLDPAQAETPDWEAIAADHALTIALMRAERKPLTDAEITEVALAQRFDEFGWALRLARAIEAKHGITGEQPCK
jgi:hypothetical protein